MGMDILEIEKLIKEDAELSGNIDNLKNQMEETKWTQRRYIKALAVETKMSEKQIKKIMAKKNDHYLDAEEAVELGIADEVV